MKKPHSFLFLVLGFSTVYCHATGFQADKWKGLPPLFVFFLMIGCIVRSSVLLRLVGPFPSFCRPTTMGKCSTWYSMKSPPVNSFTSSLNSDVYACMKWSMYWEISQDYNSLRISARAHLCEARSGQFSLKLLEDGSLKRPHCRVWYWTKVCAPFPAKAKLTSVILSEQTFFRDLWLSAWPTTNVCNNLLWAEALFSTEAGNSEDEY